MRNKLQLDIVSKYNTQVLRVIDDSFYTPGTIPDCPVLLITPPGFNYPVGFSPAPMFSLLLNSASLGMTGVCQDCELAELPDGIYIIHYSIKPNDKVWVEYNHMRTSVADKMYAGLVCTLYSKESQLMPGQFDEYQKILHQIRWDIDASKILIEECHNPKKGLEMYSGAWGDLQVMSKKLGKCINC